MRFWRPGIVGKVIGTAAFAAAIAMTPSAANAQQTISRFNQVVLNGVGRGSFGNSVSAAGDINGDGFDDVIVGAIDAIVYDDIDGYLVPRYGAGQSFVLFGSNSGFTSPLGLGWG